MSDAGEVSKTAILRNLVKDVATLKTQLKSTQENVEEIKTWAKSTLKPELQELRNSLISEIQTTKSLNDDTQNYARGISTWIKDNLGTKLEVLDAKIAAGIESRQKASEASIWAIFSAKLDEAKVQFDQYQTTMDQRHQELENQVSKMRDELKKVNALRAKAEQSVQQLEETFARLTRERADEEAQLFRKLTLKLEDERRAIEDERRKLTDERKKYKYMLEKHKFETEKSMLLGSGVYQPVMTPAVAIPTQKLESGQSSSNLTRSNSVDPITSITQTNTQKPTSGAQLVAKKLQDIGMEQYTQNFWSYGFKSLDLFSLVDNVDLDMMDITNQDHRAVILAAISEMKNMKISPNMEESSTAESKPAPQKRALPTPPVAKN